MSQHVTWMLDADIRKLLRLGGPRVVAAVLAHKIADPRVLRLVRIWREASICNDLNLIYSIPPGDHPPQLDWQVLNACRREVRCIWPNCLGPMFAV